MPRAARKTSKRFRHGVLPVGGSPVQQAGLITTRERDDGSTYHRDVFRDRLILPILDPHDPTGQTIAGFQGRRNPIKTDDDYARPKYLNTRTTPVFTKGEALYGFAEARDLLAEDALPVLVEGPMDALAITLASHGTAVGISPMGTASGGSPPVRSWTTPSRTSPKC